MRSLFPLAIALWVAWSGFGRPAYAAQECYDVSLVGRIVEARGFVPLDQLVAEADPNEVYLGGRWDLRVRVSRVLVGDGIPRTVDAHANMTSLPTRHAVLVFFLKRRDGAPWPAVHWTFAERDASGQLTAPNGESAPPRCS